MMRTSVLFGLSMAERSHRRMLVTATYAVLALLMALFIASPEDLVVVSLACVSIAWLLVGRGILASVIENTSVPQNVRDSELIDLGLTRQSHDPEKTDERDVAIRNAACFKACRVIGFYTIILVLIAPAFGTMVAVRTFEALLAPLLAMGVTLPQAIILWTEPDVPVEAPV
jgi:hypothetical protein